MVDPQFVEIDCDVCGSSDSSELLALSDSAYHQCNGCGLIYAKYVAENLQEVNEDAFSERIDKDKVKIKKIKVYRKKLRQFDRYRKTGRLLEIGCNAGTVLMAAKSRGWQVNGVDLSVTASTYAREQMELEVHTGTVETAAYPDDYFDVVYTNATLEHIRHPLSTLKECRRILRGGGIFYADTVNWDSYTREILGADWKLITPLLHVHLFTPENIVSLCEHAGLKHVKTWSRGVRIKANAAGSTLHTPWYMNLSKGPLSALCRFTNKGDSIEFIAMKE